MGYIMPITHYNYKQYQNRMREAGESPYYIDSTYRAVFHRISTGYEAAHQAFDDMPLEIEGEDDNEFTHHQDEKDRNFLHLTQGQKAKLTGKGGSINAKV